MPAKLTRERFIERSQLAHADHPDQYDYRQVEYINNLAPVTILCRDHGPFSQRAAHHMDGHGCPRCKAELTSKRCSYDQDTFIAKAKAVHGDLYDYSRINYQRTNRRVEIICRDHGPFWQTANSHVSNGSGCPRCVGKNRTTEGFIAEANVIHNGRYAYDKTDYRTIKDKIIITCPVHGDFDQTAEGHLVGRGCRFCWYEDSTSQGERDVAAWVADLGLVAERNRRDLLNMPFEIDIFLPDLQVGIEYNGCYWHSDKFDRNTRVHEFKHRLARQAGIRLITVWDYDWRHRQDVVKQHLLRALGQDDSPRIGARTCQVDTLSTAVANRLYSDHHLQGPVRGAVLHLGLLHQGSPVAAMSFTQGAARRGKADEGEWELARYATTAHISGGASRLFAAFRSQVQPRIVWSFSDYQHFSGQMYPRIGFTHDGDLPADYRVVHPNGLRTWHKSMWQRRSIPARLRELNRRDTFDPASDPRTERDMQDAVNVLRVWDAGKARWVWRA